MSYILELIEGFDHTDSAAVDMSLLDDKSATGANGWNGAGLTDTGVTPVTGRDGVGLAMRFATAEITAVLSYKLSAALVDTSALAWLMGGFAFRANFEPSDMANNDRLTLMSCLAVGGVTEAGIVVGRGGGLMCHRDRATDGSLNQGIGPVGAAKPRIRNGTWHYISFMFNVGQNSQPANGGWEVYLDRQLAVSNIDANQISWSTGNDLESVAFFKDTAAGSYDIDDFWVAQITDDTDDVGLNPGPNHYSIRHGAIRDPQVRKMIPDADGATQNWTPLSSTNVSNVDEDPDDGDTTYIESSAAADVDLYGFPNVGADVDVLRACAVGFTSRETVATGFNIEARTVHSTNALTYGTLVDTSANTTFEAKQVRARRSVGTTPSDITVTFTNPGAESADTGPPTGWTESGAVTNEQGAENSGPPTTAQAGTWWFFFDGGTGTLNNEQFWLEQEIALSTDAVPTADVDAGNLQIEFTGFLYDDGSDEGVLQCGFLDANGTLIRTSTSPLYTTGAAWASNTFTCDVPAGTRSVVYRIGAQANNNSQTVNIYWDSISAVFAYIDNSDEFTAAEADAAEFGVITS